MTIKAGATFHDYGGRVRTGVRVGFGVRVRIRFRIRVKTRFLCSESRSLEV